uniref:Uncharacterized protein n=1 Tax=Amphimedon queenslandica TaxID=400682 RepID=A0A1X7U2G0_AMPQE
MASHGIAELQCQKENSPPLNLTATNYKSLPSFQAFIDQTVFHYANNKIKVKVTVVDSIPVRRQSSCSRCDQARSRTNFFGLLQSVQWKDLLHSDPPFTIPVQIKHLATAMRQLVIEKTDNSSSKEFTTVLLGLMKTYWFCNGHCTNCKVSAYLDLGKHGLTPKVVDEVGGLQLQVEIEGYMAPVTSDTSFDSPTSSRSPPSKCRHRPLVDYKEESSSAVNSTSDHEVEESSGSSPDTEIQAYTLVEQAPATFDTAFLLGIPDVALMSCGDSPIVIVEDKFMKEVPSHVAFESDVGQLLFYVKGNLIKTSYKDSQHILGILIEGKQFLFCHGTWDRMNESLEIVISKFYNLLDADNLIYLCQTCYDVFTLNN